MNDKFSFNGNKKLRRAHVEITLDQHQIEEYEKCINDPVYFINNYVKIIVLGKGIRPFKLYPFQEKMIRNFHKNRFSIVRVGRQSGKTSTVVAYFLHQILFNEHFSIAMLAHKKDAALGILARLRLAYENLPMWIQQGIVEWNKGSIELENGSKLIASATTADGLRSGSFDEIFLDELAFVPSNIANDFFQSTFPVISSGKKTKVIISSTPKGLNYFYEMWEKATKGKSEFVPMFFDWWEVPGRDEAWKQKQIANTSEEQFREEFCAEFLGSSRTLISPEKLKFLLDTIADPIAKDLDDSLSIYEFPQEDHRYCITVDVSEGLDQDYSTFSIIDVTEIPYRQVAAYRNKKIAPIVLPSQVVVAARAYNDAHVLVEINSIGLQVADIMHYELEYENLVKIETKGRLGQSLSQGFKKRSVFGLKQTVQTKALGCSNLKALIENNKIVIVDGPTIREFTTFVSENEKFYKAEDGYNDDMVMSLVDFGWLISQRYYKEEIENNIRRTLQEEHITKLMDSDFLPLPAYNDGSPQAGSMGDGELWFENGDDPWSVTDYGNQNWTHRNF